ncbi:ParA family protein [Methanolobus bombayensis]|uniref:ParA family protein n=1 Tax=Methanolobus bombayensis TaxID=38023 RepID=UPI001AE61A8D|nr:chromosome partitioning protein [Methanolobus bombayensis]
MTKVISVMGKDGVGKSTTTINLGVAFGRKGKKVIVVDASPLGDTATCLLPLSIKLEGKIKDMVLYESTEQNVKIIDSIDFERLIRPFDSLDLYFGLIGLLEYFNFENYDYIIIDTPSEGYAKSSVFLAADTLIVPVESSSSLRTLPGVFSKIEKRKNVKEDAGTYHMKRIGGVDNTFILLTSFDSTTQTGKHIQKITDRYGKTVLDTKIPIDTSFKESATFDETIFSYNPNCKGAEAYMALAEELISKLEIEN